MTRLLAVILIGAATFGAAVDRGTARAETGTARVHALTQYDDPPLYPPGFSHWNYVNPDAPKGGDLVLSAFGTFDSLNGFIVRGTPAAGIGLLYESLITGNGDEVSTVYGGIASSFEVADDLSWVIFDMRPEARFHDGHPITAEDVVFSYDLLREQGRPLYRSRFSEISSVEALGPHRVKISFSSTGNRDLLLAAGALSILPEHYWKDRAFDRTTLEPPLGSGPYKIASLDAGRSITYERVADWWGADLPHNRGQYNFDTVRYDYYRDINVLFEAFKAGRFDYVDVTSSQEWTTGFTNLRAVNDGRLVLEEIPSTDPQGFTGFWFNLRRPIFRDPRVREAIGYFYDFETARRTVHFNLYKRIGSWFPNTELAATGLPKGEELEILERYRGKIPDAVFTTPYEPPTTDGSGSIRENMRKAMALFREAGWEIRDGVLTNVETGRPMEFQILYRSANLDKVINPFVQNLRRGGIRASARFVDTAQYTNLIDEYDFDVTLLSIRAFYPPGAELRDLWNSRSADIPGNENFTGVKDPVIDELVELVIGADSWDALTNRVRALDRVLLWNHLAIPAYYDDSYRIAYWDMFGRPETKPRYGLGFWTSWWYDPANTGALRSNR